MSKGIRGGTYIGGSCMKNKRLLSLLLCLCMAFSLLAGLGNTEANADGFTNGGYTYEYTVRSSGTSLSSICGAIGLPYDYVKEAVYILNGWDSTKNVNSLEAGTVVVLPNGTSVADMIKSGTIKIVTDVNTNTNNGNSSSGNTFNGKLQSGDYIAYYLVPHTVLSNETLYAICNSMGVSYNTYATLICSMSGITDTRNIKTGTIVYIPTLTAPSSGTYYCVVAHKVLKNETMTTICNGYNVNYYNFYTVLEGLNSNINLNYIKANQTVYVPVPSSAVTPTVSPSVSPTVSPSASPEVTGYAISFDNQGKGTTYCVSGDNTNVTRVQANEKVTIYCEPQSGYGPHSITVTRLDSDAYVPVTDNSFTMPASDVKITVLYEKGDYSIKCLTPTYGTFDVSVGGALTDNANYGDKVSLYVKPDSGYVVDYVEYQKSDGKIAAVSVRDDDNDGVYQFLMPNYNVNIKVVFKKAVMKDISYKVSYSGAQTLKGGTTAFFEYAGSKLKTGAAPVDGLVSIVVSPESGKSVDEIIVNGDRSIKVTDLGNNVYTFRMPNATTVVEIVLMDGFGTRNEHAIKEIDHSSLSFAMMTVTDSETNDVTTWATSAKAGDKVVIASFPYSGWVYESAQVTYADGSAAVVVKNDGMNDYFIMPDYDVNVVPNFVQDGIPKYGVIKYYDPSLNSNSWQYRCYNSAGLETYCFTPGEKVSLEIVPEGGYAVDTVKINYTAWTWWFGSFDWTETLKPISGNKYEFTMPNSHVTLNLTFKTSTEFAKTTLDVLKMADGKAHGDAYLQVNGHELEYAENDIGISSSIYKEFVVDAVGVGSVITVNTLPNGGYQVDYVKVRSAGWFGLTSTKTIKPNDDGEYTYTVKSSDVKTGITFEVMFKQFDRNSMPKYTVQYAFSELGMYDIYINEEERNEPKPNNYDEYFGERGYAVEGDYVTLVARPNPGYTFESVIIDGKEYRESVPGISGNFTYTFKMPAHDVSTEFTYSKVAYNLANRGVGTLSRFGFFTPDSSAGTSFTFQVGSVQNATTANYEDVVKVIPATVGENAITKVYYRFHNDTTWTLAKDNMDKDGTFTFTMSKPMDVEVCAVALVKTYNITSDVSSGAVTKIQFSEDDKSSWVDDKLDNVEAGKTIWYSLNLSSDYESYGSVTVLVNGTETTVDLTDTSKLVESDGKYYYEDKFTMESNDVLVSVTSPDKICFVKAASEKEAEYFQSLTIEGKKYAVGNKVTESLKLPDGAKVKYLNYKAGSGSFITLFDSTAKEGAKVDASIAGAGFDPVTNTVTFTMPDEDVELGVTLEYAITVKYNSDLGKVKLESDKGLTEQGDLYYTADGASVTVTATPKDTTKNKAYVTVVNADGDTVAFFGTTNPLTGETIGTFTMPAKAVTVTVEFIGKNQNYVNVIIPKTEKHLTWTASVDKIVKIGSSDEAGRFLVEEGQTVYLTVMAEDGYDISNEFNKTGFDAVTITPFSFSNEVAKTKVSTPKPNTYIFSFHMPYTDVDFSGLFTNWSGGVETGKEYPLEFAGSKAGSTVRFYSDMQCTKPIAKAPEGTMIYALITLNPDYMIDPDADAPLSYMGDTPLVRALDMPFSDGYVDVEPPLLGTVYKFKMRDSRMTVYLNEVSRVNAINPVNSNKGKFSFTDVAGNPLTDKNKVPYGTTVKPVGEPNEGYIYKGCKVEFTWPSGEVSVPMEVLPGDTFDMPQVPVKVTPIFVKAYNTLKWKNLNDNSLDLAVSVNGGDVKTYKAGCGMTEMTDIPAGASLVLSINTKNSGIGCNKIHFTDGVDSVTPNDPADKDGKTLPDGTKIFYLGATTNDSGDTILSYRISNMSSDITITTDNPIVTYSWDIGDCSIAINGTSQSGDSCSVEKTGAADSIEIKAPAGRSFRVTVSNGVSFDVNNGETMTVSVLPSGYTVNIKAVELFNLSVTGDTSYTVSGTLSSSNTTVKMGVNKSVTLTFEVADSAKVFNTIKVGTEFLAAKYGCTYVEGEDDGKQVITYTFAMPSENVNVEVTTKNA